MKSTSSRLAYLDAMGVQVWQERLAPEDVEPGAREPIQVNNLSELYEMTNACQRCDVSELRQKVVFGEGYEQAKLLIIGDFPTKQDDAQGTPFNGNEGQLLDNMLFACGIKKSSAYLTVSTKCHSSVSEEEKQAELSACREYLIKQIAFINPSVVLVFGEQAARSLLKSASSLSELRQKPCSVDDVSSPVIVSHAPSHLLETPLAKKQSWADVRLAQSLIK
ncbi:MAG: uracil-DNA glycosylase [Porticoccaceae bacterium]|nr:uracil-DNA glycosylase [Porticoccaceae bacterium]